MDSLTLFGLLGTAAFVALVHTLAGPDHYIPFIAMARAGRWSLAKTLMITVLCGVGHVGSSVVLGLVGIAAGVAVAKVTRFEILRGNLAAWLLLGFGLAYMIWGLRRAYRNQPHTHLHIHADGTAHGHVHTHHAAHTHVHAAAGEPENEMPTAHMTPWILFTIFVLGPCEPLIPLLMVPAARQSGSSVAAVAGVFAVCTIGTMLTVVALAYWGFGRLSTTGIERYAHALAGAALAACGAGMVAGL